MAKLLKREDLISALDEIGGILERESYSSFAIHVLKEQLNLLYDNYEGKANGSS